MPEDREASMPVEGHRPEGTKSGKPYRTPERLRNWRCQVPWRARDTPRAENKDTGWQTHKVSDQTPNSHPPSRWQHIPSSHKTGGSLHNGRRKEPMRLIKNREVSEQLKKSIPNSLCTPAPSTGRHSPGGRKSSEREHEAGEEGVLTKAD